MNKLYLIKSGQLLDAVKASIAARTKTIQTIRELVLDVGATEYVQRLDGRLVSVKFPTKVPKGWNARNRFGHTSPKKDCDIYERWNNIPPYQDDITVIKEITGVPLDIMWESDSGSHGSSGMSPGVWHSCGFMYPCADGPYALFLPNVEHEVSLFRAEHDSDVRITNNSDTWELDTAGLDLLEITKARWDYLVAESNLKREEQQVG